jgi:undecaprenyl-diphosphatase
VRPIGPEGSKVGFAGLNGSFHELTGENMGLYDITDALMPVPFAVVLIFAAVGAVQLIKRKKILNVDRDIIVLGIFYIAVIAVYVFFEVFVINYRPVLIEGKLEASYPSSTTMLVLTVMPTAVMQISRRLKKGPLKVILITLSVLFTAFMVIGRVISGVHWLSDIIGGVIISAGLVLMYRYFAYPSSEG